jgi:hypothetical protein
MSVNSSLILRLSHLSMQLSTRHPFIPQLPNPVVGFAAACAVALLSSRHLRHLAARYSVVCSLSITLRQCVVMSSSFLAPTLHLHDPQLSVLVVHEVANLRSFALATTPLLSFGIPARQSSSLGDWSPSCRSWILSRIKNLAPRSLELHPVETIVAPGSSVGLGFSVNQEPFYPQS